MQSLKLLPNGRKVAIIVRSQFLEGNNRYNTIFRITPPKLIYVYSFRLPRMRRFRFKGKNSSSLLAFAWFIFVKGYKGPTEVRWIARPQQRFSSRSLFSDK